MTKLDRLGRSVRDLITMLDDLKHRGVKFRSLTEAIDTETPTGHATPQQIDHARELIDNGEARHPYSRLSQYQRVMLYERSPVPAAVRPCGLRAPYRAIFNHGGVTACECHETATRLPKDSLPFRVTSVGRISFLHATVNRNKRSLTLDLRRDEGRKIFLELASRVDVIVQNFRPGTFDKWGIGYTQCRQVKPNIVYVSISGYGQFGPNHDRVGYDPLAEAESGFMSLNGAPDGVPTRCATYLCDDLAGLHGALSAVAALRHRDLTGEGQHIDVALLDSVLFQSNGFLSLAALRHPLPRLGNQSLLSAPVDVFDCCDGRIYVAVLLDSHWRVLTGMLGYPELADDPRFATATMRLEHREDCNRLLRTWLQGRNVAEAIECFDRASIPAARIRTYHEAAIDPQVGERDMLQNIQQEDGKDAPITGPAAKFSRTPTKVRRRAAALGEHTEEILAELGIDAAACERLRSMKVI